uniref:Uncharacterized protein n=1 Tax=Rhizophora mucronata TaxID=61149 RepID=A0A2P2J835_RHIMU
MICIAVVGVNWRRWWVVSVKRIMRWIIRWCRVCCCGEMALGWQRRRKREGKRFCGVIVRWWRWRRIRVVSTVPSSTIATP